MPEQSVLTKIILLLQVEPVYNSSGSRRSTFFYKPDSQTAQNRLRSRPHHGRCLPLHRG